MGVDSRAILKKLVDILEENRKHYERRDYLKLCNLELIIA